MDNISAQTLRLITALTNISSRRESARSLAKHLGAADLIIFIADPEIGVPLPAPGFPQTLPQGYLWRKFLNECSEKGHHQAELPFPDSQCLMPAAGVAAEDQSVIILFGGDPPLDELKRIGLALPLLGAVFRNERIAITAEGHLKVAREATAQAKTLAKKLDNIREELQYALITAEEATLAKDQFLAVVSHELRTPLNAILGWANMLQSGSLDNEMIKKAITTIERNARAQSQIIDDLLDISRIITGKLSLEVQPVDLTNVVMSVIDSLRPAAEAKDISVQVILNPNATMISGDPNRLQQIVWNLISNAVKFTHESGSVQARVERAGSYVEIVVSDTGKGIETEFLPYVFERFRQFDSSSTRRYGGLGLGLSIVRQLTELHGGTVSVESRGEGTGSTFIVSLPLLPLQK